MIEHKTLKMEMAEFLFEPNIDQAIGLQGCLQIPKQALQLTFGLLDKKAPFYALEGNLLLPDP